MTYEQVKNLKPEDFKRLCRVRKRDFCSDVRDSAISLTAWLRLPHNQTKRKTGRPGKLSEDRPIVDDIGILEGVPYLLSYWSILGSEESMAYRIIKKIEDTSSEIQSIQSSGEENTYYI